MADEPHSDVMRLPFERAIEELESIVKRLEEGKVPLEESVAIYERGEALKRRCEDCCAKPRPGGEDHARRRRQADRNRAAGRDLSIRVSPQSLRAPSRRESGHSVG
jgi:exodeoxyribonuclease VII small subunit